MSDDPATRFAEDGVVLLRGALDPETLAAAEAAYAWSLAHPGPMATNYESGAATFYQDVCNPGILPHYEALLCKPALPRIARTVWGDTRVWFMFEQVFLKEGGACRRTPWHQDLPYMTVYGSKLAVFWINLDPVAPEDSLEFVRGSHRGPEYNGSAFDPEDDTAPAFADLLPRLPDIEADRAAWDILSWGVSPGDVVVFHPAILHGGAPTRPGARRRTLTLRLFGDDVVYRTLPWAPDRPGEPRRTTPIVEDLEDQLAPGDPLRHPAFPQLDPAGGPLRPTHWGDVQPAAGRVRV